MIQLRMKRAATLEVLGVVREVLPICRKAGCLLIVNDDIEASLEGGADGVHLGRSDLPWAVARERSGPDFLIGGTVNSLEDAKNAVSSGALDSVGVGPYCFTY